MRSDRDDLDPKADRERAVDAAASDWLAKEDCGLEPSEQDAFFDWLGEDDNHGVAYSECREVWKDLDVLAEWKPEHSLEANPDLLAVPGAKPWRRRLAYLGGLAAAAALAFAAWEFSRSAEPPMEAAALLANGDRAQTYQRHTLEDGTVVEMNAGSQVSVRFVPGKRLVTLLKGEAYFSVAKDPSRPFVVFARGAVVQAVGTAFNVSLEAERVEVLVTEGRVLINPELNSERDIRIEPSEPLVREIGAGQRSVVQLGGGPVAAVVEEVAPSEIERRLEWKSELRAFNSTRLVDIISAFNRRNATQIILDDETLADRQVPVATLRFDNVDNFIQLITLTQNAEAERISESKILIRSAR